MDAGTDLCLLSHQVLIMQVLKPNTYQLINSQFSSSCPLDNIIMFIEVSFYCFYFLHLIKRICLVKKSYISNVKNEKIK